MAFNISESNFILIRWGMLFRKFDFDVRYENRLLNILSYALSCLRSLEETLFRLTRTFLHTSSILKTPWQTDTARSTSTLTLRLPPIPLFHSFVLHSTRSACRKVMITSCTIRSRFEKWERGHFVLNGNSILFCSTDGIQQLVIPQSLFPRVLHSSYNAKMARHTGERRLYQFLRRSFCLQIISWNCYAVSQSCVSCAKNRVALRRKRKGKQLFPATVPLEFVAVGILGQQLITYRWNRFMLVIIDQISMLDKIVPLTHILRGTTGKVFLGNWVLMYGLQKWFLSYNLSHFESKFFRYVCRTRGVSKVLATSYHPLWNRQVEGINRKIGKALPLFIAEN